MFSTNFPKIAKLLLKDLPKKDYPVLDTFLFVSCWLGWVMDQSLVSMRDLIFRLNTRNIPVHLSTFSKASKNREVKVFEEILALAIKELKKKKGENGNQILFPLDSTIITLTSKLLWCQGWHQVKLFCGLNSWTSVVGGIVIHFGQGHDSKHGDKTIEEIPENAVGIMDRGFSSLSRIGELLKTENRYFVLRIKNNMNLEILENGKCLVGTGENKVEVRVVDFCSLENKSEYRLVTNLNEDEFSNQEIGEIYRQRWGIETLWKFLKMHLKLDKLMTKNENGIRIQIYSCLIVYIILQLVDIAEEIGSKALDKLRYLQSFMNEKISYIHWFRRLSFTW
ncbi:transposase family protein (plasmid) [Cylindrospermum stagnale PCC 7417]|uniref:Transposase family protein n=1 Tax=Cylindrospermum stagnale PCC 7417 TaxID=56107 RepID=K9X8H6_9NOST|nr:transposase [Cylindrospermum stagnale]AFZ28409.1 transposase family protein [Cylindrospermum stagnale PCC 7417]